MNRTILKNNAKMNLGGGLFQNNWMIAVAACLVYSAIMTLAGSTYIGSLILTGPMTYGINYLFLKQARQGGKLNFTDIFAGFNIFSDTLLIGLLSSVFIFLWSLLLIVPGIIKYYEYSFIYYIKIDHPEYNWQMCLNESKRLTNGHKGELFVLDLSFIGWLMVGSFCLCIGTLWVTPYIFATKAQAYLFITANDTFNPNYNQNYNQNQNYNPNYNVNNNQNFNQNYNVNNNQNYNQNYNPNYNVNNNQNYNQNYNPNYNVNNNQNYNQNYNPNYNVNNNQNYNQNYNPNYNVNNNQNYNQNYNPNYNVNNNQNFNQNYNPNYNQNYNSNQSGYNQQQ